MKVCFNSCNRYNNSQRIYENNHEPNKKNPNPNYDLNMGFNGKIKNVFKVNWGLLSVGAAVLYFLGQIIRAIK